MRRIRTKLVLSLLVIAVLPVVPVYYLVKNLLQQSLEIGVNENVELALQNAAEIARELYTRYKNETLLAASALAETAWVMAAIEDGTRGAGEGRTPAQSKVEIVDPAGVIVFASSDSDGQTSPELTKEAIAEMTGAQAADVFAIMHDSGHIRAYAPIFRAGRRLGTLIVTKSIDVEITKNAQQVVRVNQMFKTLDFFAGEVSRGFVLSFLVIYLPIAIISVVLGTYFSRKITSPLLDLVKGTRTVAAGDWGYRLQVASRDEIGQLVEAFNSMVSKLKEKQDQVVELEKMAAWREIARVLAHEIKNPLTPIQLTVQQIKDKYDGRDKSYARLLDECTEIITDEIESLRALVREFSEFARMPKLSLAEGNMNELVQETCKLYPRENIKLTLGSHLPALQFDYEKMRRVLINLLENGLDSFAEKGVGEIRLTTCQEKSAVVLRYEDTGQGMPQDVLEKVFEPYFSTKKTGMGLGLAIVKRIILEHGGKIRVESALNRGTVFIISIPLVPHTVMSDE